MSFIVGEMYRAKVGDYVGTGYWGLGTGERVLGTENS